MSRASESLDDDKLERAVIDVLYLLGIVSFVWLIWHIWATYHDEPVRRFSDSSYLDLSDISRPDAGWKVRKNVEAEKTEDGNGLAINIPFSITAMKENLQQKPHAWGDRCMGVLISWFVASPGIDTTGKKGRALVNAQFASEQAWPPNLSLDPATIISTAYCSILPPKTLDIQKSYILKIKENTYALGAGDVPTSPPVGQKLEDLLKQKPDELAKLTPPLTWFLNWTKIHHTDYKGALAAIVGVKPTDVKLSIADETVERLASLSAEVLTSKNAAFQLTSTGPLIKNGGSSAVRLNFSQEGHPSHPIAGLWFTDSLSPKEEYLLLIGRDSDFEKVFSVDGKNAAIPVTFVGTPKNSYAVNVRVSVAQLNDMEKLEEKNGSWSSALLDNQFKEKRNVYRLRWIANSVPDYRDPGNSETVKFVIPEQDPNKNRGETKLCRSVLPCFK